MYRIETRGGDAMTTSINRPYPGVPVIDADGHVLEPRDLWANKLPAKYRDQAIEIRWNESTQLEDEWAGGVNIMPGLGTTNGWARLPRSVRDDPTGLRWEDLTAAGRNAKDRVVELDRDGIDLAVLYPSLGLVLGGLTDPGHAIAACAIYNDWLAEWTATAPDRLRVGGRAGDPGQGRPRQPHLRRGQARRRARREDLGR